MRKTDFSPGNTQCNCAKYFEFQFVWPELMSRLENDQILQAALLESARRTGGDSDGARVRDVRSMNAPSADFEDRKAHV